MERKQDVRKGEQPEESPRPESKERKGSVEDEAQAEGAGGRVVRLFRVLHGNGP